jgi:beta-lactamase class C
MFDPALKSGVVALWNGSSSQPGGLEFEVMDMFYKLEPRDWLFLDEKPGATPAEPAEADEGNSISPNEGN